MSFIIGNKCVGVCDTACVEVCPVDCINGPLSVTDRGAEVEKMTDEEKAKEADAMHDKIKAQAKKFAAERAHLMEVTRAVVKCKRLLEKKYASLQMEIDRSAMSESF